jgi:6-pyruvoyltetrahydropterin/6-carboxytetrahydropterin synthase
MSKYTSTKIIELGSCAFRQWRAVDTHCKYVHGYQLKAKFSFEGKLDDRNWVVNFGGLKDLKAKLQQQFDHTLCIAADDPEIQLFQKLHEAGACDLRIMSGVGIEKTAEFCFYVANEYIQELTHGRCKVSKVEVWEHDANSAIYTK